MLSALIGSVMFRAVCFTTLVAVATASHPVCSVTADDSETPATDFNDQVNAALKDVGGPRIVRFPIGRTRRGTMIWCLAMPEALNVRTSKQRILIVGGLDGSISSSETALFSVEGMEGHAKYAYAVVPIANPEGWAREADTGNFSGGKPSSGYPPEGTAYNSPTDPESQFLWRFVGWFAPDLVIEMHDESAPEWQRYLAGEVSAQDAWPIDCFASAVNQSPVAGIATTRAARWPTSAATDDGILFTMDQLDVETPSAYLYGSGRSLEEGERSPLRKTILRRLDRTPVEVAEQLAKHYGSHLDTIMYQPALALVARLRLGELTGEETHPHDVERIVSAYLDGTESTFGERVSGSHLAGHLIFAELARMAGGSESIGLVQSAADYCFNDDGSLREAMPFHNEMSDAVFMACPILTAAGRYAGDERYFEMAARHLQFMQQRCLREDGIYRHSPLCEAAWGRGNGFPALGLALSLSDLDAVTDKSAVAAELQSLMVSSLEKHLRSLVKHQDVTGMWQQVIDDPGSYRELTSTCMITYAIVRGIRAGWLGEEEFAPVANRAWEAIKVRVGEDGTLFDVCTGTGKQKSLQDYRDRTAILGRDERGGAMALMAAVEMAAWRAGRRINGQQ